MTSSSTVLSPTADRLPWVPPQAVETSSLNYSDGGHPAERFARRFVELSGDG